MLTRGAWNEASAGLVLHTGAHRSHSANLKLPELVSLNESGNKVTLGLVLRTGAHQGSLGTRLAMSLHSVLVLNKEQG